MTLNNGSTAYKGHMSFIKKGILSIPLLFLVSVLGACGYLLIAYWVEMPLALKLFGLIIIPILLVGIFMMPLNGMFVTSKAVVFVPDLRIKRVPVDKLNRISFVFSEWENGKYSVSVKIIRIDGKTFVKDYSSQFANARKKKFLMHANTINKSKVEELVETLSDWQFAETTIVDKNGKIVFQNVDNALFENDSFK